MTSTIVWVHGDCLAPDGPALRAYPDAPAVFVWDDALLQRRRLSLKRIVFIYECLLELPVTIVRGNVATEVTAFAAAHGARRVATSDSVSPGFAAIRRRLATALTVEVLAAAPFVPPDVPFDLRRFSRYWQRAGPLALQPTPPDAP
jgi:deoxyribodipyrimidine photo-lyase